jgi:hypothetical protein
MGDADDDVAAAPMKTVTKTVCCHNMKEEDFAVAGVTLLKAQCNRVSENCAWDGCVENVHKQLVCDCTSNTSFYVSFTVAVFGLAMGLYYWPPRCSDEVSPFHKCVAIAGYAAVSYLVYRASTPLAAVQLDMRSCRAKGASLRGRQGRVHN